MDSSSGKSTHSRLAICSGLHAVDLRLSWRWGLFSPFHGGVLGPATIVPSGRRTFPGEPVLHVLAQPVIAYQLRCLRALGGLLRLPLRHHGAVDRLARPGRGIASELARNGPRIAADRACDLPHALSLRLEQRDLLTLSERQVSA